MAEYLNNNKFTAAIIAYRSAVEADAERRLRRKNCPELPALTVAKAELWGMINLLCDRLWQAKRTYRLDRDDAVQDAMIHAIEKLPNFDPAKGKAFVWFTTVILNFYRAEFNRRKDYQLRLERIWLSQQQHQGRKVRLDE